MRFNILKYSFVGYTAAGYRLDDAYSSCAEATFRSVRVE